MTGGSEPPSARTGASTDESLVSADFVSTEESSDSFLRAVAAASVRGDHVAQLDRAGSQLGRYRIAERIGSGGMGIVYRASDPEGRDVALKVLRRKEGDSPDARRRFLREARVAAAVVHPHVVRVIELGEGGDEAFIAMELLAGESLRSRLARAPISLREAVRVGLDVVRGVGAAHDASVIHRDLKPENVWIGPDGRAKVLDFGLARWLDDGSGGLRSVLTVQGGILGTVGYMSPEQGRGQPVDAQSDLFSLGVILFEMIAHRRPFTGSSPTDVFLATACDAPPDLHALSEGLPPRLEALVLRLLEKSQAARPAGAASVAAELEAILEALSG